MAYKQHFDEEYREIIFDKLFSYLKKEGTIFDSFESMLEGFQALHGTEVSMKTFREWLDDLGFTTSKKIIVEHSSIPESLIEEIHEKSVDNLDSIAKHPSFDLEREVKTLLKDYTFDNETEPLKGT